MKKTYFLVALSVLITTQVTLGENITLKGVASYELAGPEWTLVQPTMTEQAVITARKNRIVLHSTDQLEKYLDIPDLGQTAISFIDYFAGKLLYVYGDANFGGKIGEFILDQEMTSKYLQISKQFDKKQPTQFYKAAYWVDTETILYQVFNQATGLDEIRVIEINGTESELLFTGRSIVIFDFARTYSRILYSDQLASGEKRFYLADIEALSKREVGSLEFGTIVAPDILLVLERMKDTETLQGVLSEITATGETRRNFDLEGALEVKYFPDFKAVLVLNRAKEQGEWLLEVFRVEVTEELPER